MREKIDDETILWKIAHIIFSLFLGVLFGSLPFIGGE